MTRVSLAQHGARRDPGGRRFDTENGSIAGRAEKKCLEDRRGAIFRADPYSYPSEPLET